MAASAGSNCAGNTAVAGRKHIHLTEQKLHHKLLTWCITWFLKQMSLQVPHLQDWGWTAVS